MPFSLRRRTAGRRPRAAGKRSTLTEIEPGHYSPGVLSHGTLYISGQLPNDPETDALPDGIEAQTQACLDKIDTVLRAAGLTRSRVVQCRAFVADSSLWEPVNRVYAGFFGSHKPARIIVPTRDLRPGLLVEIEAVAEVE